MSELTSASTTLFDKFSLIVYFATIGMGISYGNLYNDLIKKGVKLSPKEDWVTNAILTKRKRMENKISYCNPLKKFRDFWLYIESNVYPSMIDICECCNSILGIIEQ